MPDDLTENLVALVDEARVTARTAEVEAELAGVSERLRGPLRLAIAGKVKAGKSTLLNALLGEELAPTNAQECTKIVTWYRVSHRPYAKLFPRQGEPAERPFRRTDGALDVDLGGRAAEDVDHLEIGWPTEKLRHLTLVDTPGIASISAEVSARTHRVLSSQDDRVPVTDAVLYLLRHTHSSDVRFLESFHDDDLAHGTPMNSIGVLSRADEIGSCRLDAMDVADRVARRYEADPRLHRLCPLVVPVNGLLALAATTLREREFAALTVMATATEEQIAELLLTADRLARGATTVPIELADRAALIDRLGLFGVRLSVELIRSARAATSGELADQLASISGLGRLRSVVLNQFEARSRVLKARSAVQALKDIVRRDGSTDDRRILGRLEEITASAHEFEEVRLLSDLRSGGVDMTDQRVVALDRLLGGSGHGASSRLGLPDDATPDQVRDAARSALGTWRSVAEHPLSSRSAQLAARTAVRTVEGLLAASTRDVPEGASTH